MNIKLACQPDVVEPVKDRLPNSRIIGKDGNHTILSARVFGEGFWRWALQYGDALEVLEPESMRNRIADEAMRVAQIYSKA